MSQKVSDVLRVKIEEITNKWLRALHEQPDLMAIPLTREERSDHIPVVLKELIVRMDQSSNDLSKEAVDAALIHGRTRYRQGYTIPQIVSETRILQHTLAQVLEESLEGVELGPLVHDVLRMGESHHAMLEISVRGYQSEIPPSLQNSLALLFHSAHLGVVTCNENWIIDANDSFLRMVGYTREELGQQRINWQALAGPEYLPLDLSGIEQLREYGVCMPFEQEFVRRDGRRLRVMVGAVRLSLEPLEWAAYLVDLSEHLRAAEAERRASELLSRKMLVNQLAHEINNPLAALTFTIHLLKSHPDAPEDVRGLVNDSQLMLDRISESVRAVLAAVGTDEQQQAAEKGEVGGR